MNKSIATATPKYSLTVDIAKVVNLLIQAKITQGHAKMLQNSCDDNLTGLT